jgi:hypothetical protein
MKLKQATQTVEVNTDAQPLEFDIAIDGTMYDLLSSSLYTNKYLAILRELGANAFDSHVAAGIPEKQFLVHLPCQTDPTLKIRDFGVGLSPEQVATIYRSYGTSDKRDTNKFIGAMGLGAKSPLAYSDSYTFRTWHGGRRFEYTVYRNERRIPCLVPLAVEESGEAGTEIVIPVRTPDFYQFRMAAGQAYRFFAPRPLVTGGHVDYKATDYKIKTGRYGLVQSRGDSLVVMGNIGYPIDAASLTLSEKESFVRQLIEYGVHLFLPIGAIAVTGSREAISYDPKTIARLRHELKFVADDVRNSFNKKMEEAKDLWAARCLHAELEPVFVPFFGRGFALRWREQDVRSHIDFDTKDWPFDEVSVLSLEHNYYASKVRERRAKHRQLTINDSIDLVVVNDIPAGAFARTFRELAANGWKKAVVLPAEATDEVLDRLGRPPALRKASELPKPEVYRDAATGKVLARKPKALMRRWDRQLAVFENEKEVELSAGGVYVQTFNKTYNWPRDDGSENFVGFPYLNAVWDPVRTLAGDIELYSIRTADLQRVLKEGEWVDLKAYAKALLKRLTPSLLEKAQLAATNVQMGRCGHDDLWKRRYAAGSDYGRFAELADRAHAAARDPKVLAFKSLHEQLGGSAVGEHKGLRDAELAAYKAYPLLVDASLDRCRTIYKENGSYSHHGRDKLVEVTSKQVLEAAHDYIRLLDEERSKMTTTRATQAASA